MPASPTSPPGRQPLLSGLGLFTVLLGAALAPIDQFIVNVALPDIRTELHASAADLVWVVAAFGLALALLQVVGGRVGDAFGRRRLFQIGMLAFSVTSLLCGLAPTIGALIAARAAQGAAAALLVPQVLAIIQATTDPAARRRVLGLYGATGGIAMVIGQVLGGVLVTADVAGTGWRPVFFVVVPIGLLVAVMAGRTIPETRSDHPLAIDGRGTILLGITVLALLVPLTLGESIGWPLWTWASLAISPLLLWWFLRVEHRLEQDGRGPLMPPSLLRYERMGRGLLLFLPFFMAFGGFLFVFPITLQEGLHFSAIEAGLVLTPFALAFLAVSLMATRLGRLFGHRVMIYGPIIEITGIGLLIAASVAWWPNLTLLELAPGSAIAGAGQAMMIPAIYQLVLSGVPVEQAGAGSGALTTTQQVFLATGVAIIGATFAALTLPGPDGMRTAFAVSLGIVAALIAAIGLLAHRMHRPTARAGAGCTGGRDVPAFHA
ncbi:MFS transporter [Conexibacter sp. CPCC 206217]|uniref:MFS transporter n=1 Tax=Conexibacter sp. CPCC 206217 TaxID=3064574 RepID=UPI0027270078|nr:MFS transporter [Conexibacter sp. CPCC 206217]MDO8212654.1 MFS transporter [Conexibacter sp. CPCC 206217]